MSFRKCFEEGASYFVTTATKGRRPIFQDSKLSRLLLIGIEYHKTLLDYRVFGYCLMPDHLHLIVKPSNQFNLSFIMKMIKGSFARKTNKVFGKVGPVWQAGYYDQGIRETKQLITQLEYMHQNPVKAGLASTASDYLLSSHNQYHSKSLEHEILLIDPID